VLRILLTILLMCFALSTYAQESATVDATLDDEMKQRILDDAHVRGFVWGLPPAIIKTQEKGFLIDEAEDGTLFFGDDIDGMKASVSYEFDNDKLFRARIFSDKTYSRPQERIDDLARVKRYLDARFGPPLKEDLAWKSNKDQNFPDDWGWTVYRGELNITITWEDEDTFVTAFLGAPKPFNPVMFFTYEDVKHRQARLEKALKISP